MEKKVSVKARVTLMQKKMWIQFFFSFFFAWQMNFLARVFAVPFFSPSFSCMVNNCAIGYQISRHIVLCIKVREKQYMQRGALGDSFPLSQI